MSDSTTLDIQRIKRCSKCGSTRPLSDFYANKLGKMGVHSQCIACHRIRSRRHNQQNKAVRSAYDAEWRARNSEHVTRRHQRYMAKRYATDAEFRISECVRKAMYQAVSGCSARSLSDLPYTVSALRDRLEAQFTDGMTWDNYGEWHIDHIVPKSWFSYDSADDWQFKVCWSLANLQPLWASDNVAKGSRWAG